MRDAHGRNAAVARELREIAASECIAPRVLDLDVTSTHSIDAAAATVLAESGAPDVLVNNAGQILVVFTAAFTAHELAEQMGINMVGVHRLNHAFLLSMRERGSGLVINISSVAVDHWNPDMERWFVQGVDTPGVMVIKLRATRLNYWDGEDHDQISSKHEAL